METPSQTICWCPGDIAVITDGEFVGMYARVWSVNATTDRAMISLRVFRENVPFEIDVAALRQPSPSRQWKRALKAALFSLTTLVSGPLVLFFYLYVMDYVQGGTPVSLICVDTFAAVFSCPLFVSAFFAASVGLSVLTEPEAP